jgi:hypothetical protein
METEANFDCIYTTHLVRYMLRGVSPFISGTLYDILRAQKSILYVISKPSAQICSVLEQLNMDMDILEKSWYWMY